MDEEYSVELTNVSKSFKIQIEGDKSTFLRKQKKTVIKKNLMKFFLISVVYNLDAQKIKN